jgi:haloacetate dehalogenase
MFDGFEERTLPGAGAGVFARLGGRRGAPPLLLLHGYPQTGAMWHRVAPRLADCFELVVPDLRGYGRSGQAPDEADHAQMSKRAMAGDLLAAMDALGHGRFLVAAHDRGARVAHRLAMDAPDRVGALLVLDIAPTREMLQGTNRAFAETYWHWFFLTRPAPLPERMIGADPEGYWRAKCIAQAGGDPFAPEAMAEYLARWTPEAIHASCEDYRAAASIDVAHDDADGAARLPMPLRVLWAERGAVGRCFDPLALWRLRAERVEGRAVAASHFMAEEIPEEVAGEIARFLLPQA